MDADDFDVALGGEFFPFLCQGGDGAWVWHAVSVHAEDGPVGAGWGEFHGEAGVGDPLIADDFDGAGLDVDGFDGGRFYFGGAALPEPEAEFPGGFCFVLWRRGGAGG